MNKIGVILEGFKTDVYSAIQKSAQVGASGVQFYGGIGALDCDKLSASDKKLFQTKLIENNLEVTAICSDLGGHGFAVKAEHKYRVDKTYRIMEWAKELNCSVITTHIGVISENMGKQRENIARACKSLNEWAKALDIYIAIETGPEKIKTLHKFLKEINCSHIAVNYDPANLVMVTGENPIDGVYELKKKIVHTHVKNGIMKKQTDPAIIYNYFAEGGIKDFRLSDYFEETPLLEGDVNISEWLNALHKINYDGYLTIERETFGQEHAYEEIGNCVKILKNLLSK